MDCSKGQKKKKAFKCREALMEIFLTGSTLSYLWPDSIVRFLKALKYIYTVYL